MKYTVSCRHPLVYLQQADEVRIEYKDRGRLGDLILDEKPVNVNIYFYIPKDQMIEWEAIDAYQSILNITIAAADLPVLTEAKNKGYRVMWSYPVYTYWELREILRYGVDEVILEAPLYFDLAQAKSVCGDVEIRLTANQCVNTMLPLEHPECGTYIRPEDVAAYEPYVSHIDFVTDSLEKESTLVKVYKSGVWKGNLNLLLTGLSYNIDNRSFDPGFAKRRINCAQRCQRNNSCHACSALFSMYTAIRENKDWLQKQLNDS